MDNNFVADFTDRRWFVFHTVNVEVLSELYLKHILLFGSLFEMMDEFTEHSDWDRIFELLSIDDDSTESTRANIVGMVLENWRFEEGVRINFAKLDVDDPGFIKDIDNEVNIKFVDKEFFSVLKKIL